MQDWTSIPQQHSCKDPLLIKQSQSARLDLDPTATQLQGSTPNNTIAECKQDWTSIPQQHSCKDPVLIKQSQSAGLDHSPHNH